MGVRVGGKEPTWQGSKIGKEGSGWLRPYTRGGGSRHAELRAERKSSVWIESSRNAVGPGRVSP